MPLNAFPKQPVPLNTFHNNRDVDSLQLVNHIVKSQFVIVFPVWLHIVVRVYDFPLFVHSQLIGNQTRKRRFPGCRAADDDNVFAAKAYGKEFGACHLFLKFDF